MTILVLDKYYLAITLLVTIVYQLSGFAIAWTFQVNSQHRQVYLIFIFLL
jgi:hypothetical protein